MTLFRCPRCQLQRVVTSSTTDYVCQCESPSEALQNEDIPIIGQWQDYTGVGSDIRLTEPSVTNQNLGNKLYGTEGWVRDNAKNVDWTTRGANKQMNRPAKPVCFNNVCYCSLLHWNHLSLC